MIAQVYPIIKLPRRCGWFDYAVTTGIQLSVGDLVRIPFKQREVFGVIRSVSTPQPGVALKAITRLAESNFLTAADIDRYEKIATHLVQSVSSVLCTSLSPVKSTGTPTSISNRQNITVNKRDLDSLKQCLSVISNQPVTSLAGNLDLGLMLAHALSRKSQAQCLFLFPRERDVELATQLIDFGAKTAKLTGRTQAKDKDNLLRSWQAGGIKVLLGTRQASLLPAKKLEHIVVFEAGNEEHHNLRRNPRFDAREAAKLLAKQHQAHLVFYDPLPRLEEHALSPIILATDYAAPTVIDLKTFEQAGTDPLLSVELIEALQTNLAQSKKALLYLNRKGVAKRLQCASCGHVPVCGTCGHVPNVQLQDLKCSVCLTEMWLPEVCPACHKSKLKLRAIGGTKLADNLKRHLPTANIVTVEKNALNLNQLSQADVIVATEAYFSSIFKPFTNKPLGLLVDVLAELPLYGHGFRGAEVTARKLHRLAQLADRYQADCLVQTWLPDIIKPMFELDKWLKTECKLREKYRLPPLVNRAVIEGRIPEQLLADMSISNLSSEAEQQELMPVTAEELDLLKTLPDSLKLTYDGAYG